VRECRSDASGAYVLEGLTEGRHELAAESDEAGAFVDGVAVVLARGEARANVDLELRHGAAIRGSVVDQNGAPVPGVYVHWLNTKSSDGASAITAPDGGFACDMMMGGDYRPTVRLYKGAEGSLPAVGGTLPTVTLADGNAQVTGVKLAVRLDHASISGKVVDGAGQPLADARVLAGPQQAGREPSFNRWLRRPAATTDADGGFRVGDLPTGTYALQARAADGAQGITRDVAAGASGVVVAVVQAGSIEGRLVGFTPDPAVFAQAVVDPHKDSRGVVSGASFHIDGLPPGRYAVTAQNPGTGDVAQVQVEPGKATPVTLTARGSGSLEITVHERPGGAPVAQAACLVTAADPDVPGVTSWDPGSLPRTGSDGRVVVDPAPAGPVTLLCVRPGDASYSQARAATTVPRGGRTAVTVDMVHVRDKDAVADAGLGFDWRYAPPRVDSVRRGGPGARAGVQPGDTVLAVDGASAASLSASAFIYLMRNHAPGDQVKLTLGRAAGATATVVLTLDAGPER
jgi:hypothetical protein